MDGASLAKQLRDIANAHLDFILSKLPKEPEHKFIWFLEIQRVFDVATIQQQYGRREPSESQIADYDILRMGMNLATSHLLLRLQVPLGLPLARSTGDSRARAVRLLYEFGLVNVARRTADMVEHGFLLAERKQDVFVFRDSGAAAAQFMDRVEWDLLDRAESEWAKGEVTPQGWAVRDSDELQDLKQVGAYWARSKKGQGEGRLSPERLEELMTPLIRPWEIPQGTLMGYDADREVDDHFIEEAGSLVLHFQAEAGIHPEAVFDKYNGLDLLKVTLLLISLFRKHVAFGLLAAQHVPAISVKESLTIWGPRVDLATAICDELGMGGSEVEAVLKSLTVGPEDVDLLEKETTPLLPMLIDLGNGFVLRPVSSLSRNPLAGFHTIARWRSSSSRNDAAQPRESWMRNEIYSVFGGSRYLRVEGNVVLRRNGQKLTDVDAVVFDRTNGELALIQIKWQDYLTNDIRELRSKARNFTTEVDAWAQKVTDWLSVNSPDQVAQALRLRLRGPQRIASVFLFAVSRSVARTHGYGFPVRSPFLSVASWPQFRRVRCQIGPASSVISKIHEMLREEENLVLSGLTPIPVEVGLQGVRLRFEDLWNKWDEATGSPI